ncbi:MAG TPA: ribonuclease P protein component [Flavisolibacter sp.]|nr:ribonuclease P protein component [Flavisolibacter sp.]
MKKRYRSREKLKSRTRIDELFQKGKSLSVPPIRLSFQFEPASGAAGLQAGVTASKKNFKRAVDRNRLKRVLRESYRLQKESLVQLTLKHNLNGYLFFIYTSKTMMPFAAVQEAMAKCLQKLESNIGAKHEKPS